MTSARRSPQSRHRQLDKAQGCAACKGARHVGDRRFVGFDRAAGARGDGPGVPPQRSADDRAGSAIPPCWLIGLYLLASCAVRARQSDRDLGTEAHARKIASKSEGAWRQRGTKLHTRVRRTGVPAGPSSHAQLPPDPRRHADPVRPLPLLGVRLLRRPGPAHPDPRADQGSQLRHRLSGRHPDRGRHAGSAADLAAMRSTLDDLGLGEIALQEFGGPDERADPDRAPAGRRGGAVRCGRAGQGRARRALRRRRRLSAGRVRRPEGERGSALGRHSGDDLRPDRHPCSTSGSASNGSSPSGRWSR